MKLATCIALAVLTLSACAEQATYPGAQQGGACSPGTCGPGMGDPGMGGPGMGGPGMGGPGMGGPGMGGPGMHAGGGGPPGMRGDIGPGVWRANPNFPNVDVINDTHIVVDQEPIFIPRNFTDKRITWQLPRDSRYRFDRENGVTVGPEVSSGHRAFSECKPEMNELRYTCRNDGTPGSYKYTIRVTGPASVPPLDPFIRNG